MESFKGNLALLVVLWLSFFMENTDQTSLQSEDEILNSRPTEPNTNGVWSVLNEETSSPCILLKGSIEFKVNSGLENEENVVKVSPNAISEGTCTTLWGDYQDIKLIWQSFAPDIKSPFNNSIYFGFATKWDSEFSDLSIDSGNYALNTITVVYHGKLLNESSNSTLISYSVADFISFLTPINQSYTFVSKDVLKLGELEITFLDLNFQAFRNDNKNGTDFSNSILCSLDENKNHALQLFLTILFWFLIACFAICILGVFTYVAFKLIRKRLEGTNIGYRIIGTT